MISYLAVRKMMNKASSVNNQIKNVLESKNKKKNSKR